MNKIILLYLFLVMASCASTNESKVTIAVAANMQHTMQSLVSAFEASHDIQVEISSSSSGILTTQIRQGAPFDLFLSADMNHPNILFTEGFCATQPKIYAQGKLILWTYKKKTSSELSVSYLLHTDIQKIALANAETAPYGLAATTALSSAGLIDSLRSKLVIGESISQVNQYIQSMNVDIGLTSKSVLTSPFISDQGSWVEVPDSLYSPINQGIVLLKHGEKENLSNSEQFFKFMFSKEAKEILSHHGYQVAR